MTPTPTRPVPAPRTARPLPEPAEPFAGVWGYRLAVCQAAALLVVLVPATLALGLRWLTWEQAQTFAPLLQRLALAAWVTSLLGLILGVLGLSQFGGKTRTLRGLALHLLVTVGPLCAALVVR